MVQFQYPCYESLVQGKGDNAIVDLGERPLVTTCRYHYKLLSACFICHRNGSCARWKRAAPQQLPGFDIVGFQVSIEGCADKHESARSDNGTPEIDRSRCFRQVRGKAAEFPQRHLP